MFAIKDRTFKNKQTKTQKAFFWYSPATVSSYATPTYSSKHSGTCFPRTILWLWKIITSEILGFLLTLNWLSFSYILQLPRSEYIMHFAKPWHVLWEEKTLSGTTSKLVAQIQNDSVCYFLSGAFEGLENIFDMLLFSLYSLTSSSPFNLQHWNCPSGTVTVFTGNYIIIISAKSRFLKFSSTDFFSCQSWGTSSFVQFTDFSVNSVGIF